MEKTKWIRGLKVKQLLGFEGIELVLISMPDDWGPRDPITLAPISCDLIQKIKDSWKFACALNPEIRYDDELLNDLLVGKHIKDGIKFKNDCRARYPIGLLEGNKLAEAIEKFDKYLYDSKKIEKHCEEIIASYRNHTSPKDFVMMFKNKLAAHEGFSFKQTETLSIRLKKRFPEANFSDEDIAQLIVAVFQKCRCEQEQNIIQADEKQPKRSKNQIAQDIKVDREKSFDRLLEKALVYAEEFILQNRRMRKDADLYPYLCKNSDGAEVSHNTKTKIWKKLPPAARKGPGAPKKTE